MKKIQILLSIAIIITAPIIIYLLFSVYYQQQPIPLEALGTTYSTPFYETDSYPILLRFARAWFIMLFTNFGLLVIPEAQILIKKY